jgi:hypothetical protein
MLSKNTIGLNKNKRPRFLFLISVLLTTAFAANCQDMPQGKWYLFSRNRMVEITITKDSMIDRQLNWDLSPRDPDRAPGIQRIGKQVTAHQNIYLYTSNSKDSTGQTGLTTIKVIAPGKEIILAVNAKEIFADTVKVSQYITNDTGKKFGMPLFSAAEIKRMQDQKNISQMTAKDFTRYVEKILQFRKEVDSLSKIEPDVQANGLLYYSYAMLRIIFAQIGYNPLINNTDLDTFIIRFKNDPETKDICNKLF